MILECFGKVREPWAGSQGCRLLGKLAGDDLVQVLGPQLHVCEMTRLDPGISEVPFRPAKNLAFQNINSFI